MHCFNAAFALRSPPDGSLSVFRLVAMAVYDVSLLAFPIRVVGFCVAAQLFMLTLFRLAWPTRFQFFNTGMVLFIGMTSTSIVWSVVHRLVRLAWLISLFHSRKPLSHIGASLFRLTSPSRFSLQTFTSSAHTSQQMFLVRRSACSWCTFDAFGWLSRLVYRLAWLA